ncbi:MAG: hypothetical protein IKL24_06875 [Clostridia bacterium]|nr:hypothetical protein [Clostridia bacterium]
MSKHSQKTGFAKYIACGLVIGSAVGTCAAVMMTTKRSKPEGIRDKALVAVDAVGGVMQSIANMIR